jgi:hypothetical protein
VKKEKVIGTRKKSIAMTSINFIIYCIQLDDKVKESDISEACRTLGKDEKTGKHLVEKDGFGGLVVSMLSSGSRVRGFDPDRSRWIFSDVEKILSTPSFGGEVK